MILDTGFELYFLNKPKTRFKNCIIVYEKKAMIFLLNLTKVITGSLTQKLSHFSDDQVTEGPNKIK